MNRTKIFLDSNVYRYLVEKNESILFKKFVNELGIKVSVCEGIILELYRIPDPKIRFDNFKLISKFIKSDDYIPIYKIETDLLLQEIKNKRPHWLQTPQALNAEKAYLNQQKRLWKSFKGLKWNKIENYAKHLKKDPKDTIETQKDFRKKLLTDEANISSIKENFKLASILEKSKTSQLIINRSQYDFHIQRFLKTIEIEFFTRPFYEMTPFLFLFTPHINFRVLLEKHQLIRFLYEDFNLKSLPTLLIKSFVEDNQLFNKISSGNSGDIKISHNLFGNDYFLTCDKEFFKILIHTRKYLKDGFDFNLAEPILIKRSEHSALNQLKNIFD